MYDIAWEGSLLIYNLGDEYWASRNVNSKIN